jgi:hypothetical protein
MHPRLRARRDAAVVERLARSGADPRTLHVSRSLQLLADRLRDLPQDGALDGLEAIPLALDDALRKLAALDAEAHRSGQALELLIGLVCRLSDGLSAIGEALRGLDDRTGPAAT